MANRDSLDAGQDSAGGFGASTSVSGRKGFSGLSNATMLFANACVSKWALNVDGWSMPG